MKNEEQQIYSEMSSVLFCDEKRVWQSDYLRKIFMTKRIWKFTEILNFTTLKKVQAKSQFQQQIYIQYHVINFWLGRSLLCISMFY